MAHRLTPEILRALRVRVYDKTQIEFSRMCGISYSLYRKLERNELPISINAEKRIRLALGLTNYKLARVRRLIDNPLDKEE